MSELAGAYCEKRKQQSNVILWKPSPEEQFQAELETRPKDPSDHNLQPAACSYLQTDKGPTGLAVDRVWSFLESLKI